MSLDDYLNRVPKIPPVVDLNEQQSSLDVDYDPLAPGRTHLLSADDKNRGYNVTIPRFASEFWTLDSSMMMAASLLPSGARSFQVPVQWRTNTNFLDVRWNSKDTLNHQNFRYQEQTNYENLIVAFQHNPDVPDMFTATIENSAGVFTYRLAPYGWNQTTKRYECLDTRFSTGKTYPATVYSAGDAVIPAEDMRSYRGRTDYIYILDFNDLRLNHNYLGGLIDPRRVNAISFDCVNELHGLGELAYIARMVDNKDGTSQIEIGGAHITAQLTAGDKLQTLWRYYDGAGNLITRTGEWSVISYDGFGTSALSVKVQGGLPGWFVTSEVLYARKLAASAPIAVVDEVKHFANFTMTGTGLKTLGKRRYIQAAHTLGMGSNLDENRAMTPERQVNMVHDLGYRNNWTNHLGIGGYFNARTAYEDAASSSLVLTTEVLDWPVLYAGEAQLNGQFTVGRTPERGIDQLHDTTTGEWEVNVGGIMPFNGTTLASAVDKAAAAPSGSFWWDLELDVPGPALHEAISAMRGREPRGVVWCQGDTDAIAIDRPGTRNPVPTIARSKLATEKVFAHFRTLWGATLPIFIQEQAWGWTSPDPVNPGGEPGTGGPIQPGAPTYLRVRRTSWGDLVFEWKSYVLDPVMASYRVEIYNPVKPTAILHSFTVPGSQEDNGYVYADWAVEQNIPIRALIDSAVQPWEAVKWRVVSISGLGEIPSNTLSGLVPLDNTIVKKLIVCGPNRYMGEYFADRKDRSAASTMRVTYADEANMRVVQIMPLDVSDEFRDPDAPEDNKHGLILKDWWNSIIPGPSLLAATQKINALGLPVAHIAMGNPGETELMREMDPAEILNTVETLRLSNIAMLDWMRANWDNPNLFMWMQGATSIWEGNTVPVNVNVMGTKAVRDMQSVQCHGSPDFLLGSYIPGGDAFQNFQRIGNLRQYPNPDILRLAAAQMGESMALNIDRAVIDSGECPDMVLEVTPQYGLTGNGWHALYAAYSNGGKYAAAGEVNIPNSRLAYLLLSSTGPEDTKVLMTGTPVLPGEEPIYTLNGIVTEPNTLTNTLASYPAWGPYYTDDTVDPGELRYSDNTLVFAFMPLDSAYLADRLYCSVYDDSNGGALVYETVLYRAGNDAALGTTLYTEKQISDATVVPPGVYVPAHVAPPFNPATALAGHNLRFELASKHGVFPYYNATSVAIWGNEDAPLESIKLSKNGGEAVTLTPAFFPVELSPNEFSGQWRVDLNETVLEIGPTDTIDVMLPGVCDHDTGEGCDNPIEIAVDGLEYIVAPQIGVGGFTDGWGVIWATQDNGLWDAAGAISPGDFLGFVMVTGGMSTEGGSNLNPNTTVVRWGQGTEGFTHCVIKYKNVDYQLPLTWFPAPGVAGNGVWQYAAESAVIDMSTGGSFIITFHGGIATGRTVQICDIGCLGCDLNETYTTSNIVYGSEANISCYEFVKEMVQNEAFDCPTCKFVLEQYGEPVSYINSEGKRIYTQGLVMNQTVNLADTELEIVSMEGTIGGYTQRFSLIKDGVQTDAGTITYINNSGTVSRTENLLVPIFEFGAGPGQYTQLNMSVNSTISGTVYETRLPPMETMTIHDAECLLGIIKPVCCHFVYPEPDPENE